MVALLTRLSDRFNRLTRLGRFLVFFGVTLALLIALLGVPFAWRGGAFIVMAVAVAGAILGASRHDDLQTIRTTLGTLNQRVGLLRWGVLAGAVLCMLVAAVLARPVLNNDWMSAWRWWWAGVAFMGVLLLLSPRKHDAPTVRWRWWSFARQAEEGRIRWHVVLIGVAMIALALQVNTLTYNTALEALESFLYLSPFIQITCLLAGWGLCAWGLSGAPRLQMPRLTVTRHQILVCVILGGAFVVRLLWLDDWILRWLDEIHYADAVVRLWLPAPAQVLRPFSDLTAFSWFYPYAQSLVVSFAGANLWSLRLVSAVFGVVGVGAVYFLGRELVNKRVGVVAMLVMASFPVHLHFSRIGISNIADPVFGTLAVAFLARGFRTRHTANFAWAGVMLGLTAYFYEGGRLFFLPFVACWLGWLWLFGRNSTRYQKPSLRHIAIFVATTVLVTTPLYYTWTMHRVPLTPRLDAMGELTTRANLADQRLELSQRVASIIGRMQLPLRALTQAPDSSWFYGGQTGILLFVVAPFLLWGMAQAFWRVRSVAGSLLFWWVTGAAAGIALISDPLATPRYLVLLPPLAVLMGWGSVWVSEQLPQRAQVGALATMSLAIVLIQGVYYLGYHMPVYYYDRHYIFFGDEARRLPDTDEAMLRAVTFAPDGSDIYIVSRNLIWSLNSTTMVRYYRFGDDVTMRHVFPNNFDTVFVNTTDPTRPRVFMLEGDDATAYQTLQKHVALDPIQNGTYSPYAIPRDAQMRLFYAPAQPPNMDDVAE